MDEIESCLSSDFGHEHKQIKLVVVRKFRDDRVEVDEVNL
jgi:hypothetical protein